MCFICLSRNEASKQCQLSIECFELLGDEEIISGNETIESSNLFMKKQRLIVNPNCII